MRKANFWTSWYWEEVIWQKCHLLESILFECKSLVRTAKDRPYRVSKIDYLTLDGDRNTPYATNIFQMIFLRFWGAKDNLTISTLFPLQSQKGSLWASFKQCWKSTVGKSRLTTVLNYNQNELFSRSSLEAIIYFRWDEENLGSNLIQAPV